MAAALATNCIRKPFPECNRMRKVFYILAQKISPEQNMHFVSTTRMALNPHQTTHYCVPHSLTYLHITIHSMSE